MEYYVAIGKGKPLLTTLVKEEGSLQFRNMKWTLPYTYFDKKTNSNTTRELLNSTAERVFFQHKSLIYKQRCLIPIDGYFEYHHFQGDTYPYFIYPTKKDLFYAGGIWEREVDQETGEVFDMFSIITTPPNPLIGKIHNNPKAPNGPRMLLLIPGEDALNYLDENLNTNQIKELLKPLNDTEMKAHTVARFLKKEFVDYINSPRVQEYFEYPELAA
jgi:putative SOS response-associated peptidase YedK